MAPLAAPAPQSHDHGWSSTATRLDTLNPGLVIRGTNGGGILYTGIPAYVPTFIVTGTDGGGIQYTGIPYSAPDGNTVQGGRGTRFAR